MRWLVPISNEAKSISGRSGRSDRRGRQSKIALPEKARETPQRETLQGEGATDSGSSRSGVRAERNREERNREAKASPRADGSTSTLAAAERAGYAGAAHSKRGAEGRKGPEMSSEGGRVVRQIQGRIRGPGG